MITSLGNNSIVNLYLGNILVDKAYLGDELVWPVNPVLNYITFTALAANSTVGLRNLSDNQSLEYSTDLNTWNTFDTNTTINLINVNDKVYVRGVLNGDNGSEDYTRFEMTTGQIAVSGNCNALWNYLNMDAALYEYCGAYLFNGCTALSTASDFVLGKNTIALSDFCYECMFKGCSNLSSAPKLPATTLSDGCYHEMFYDCILLSSSPILPALTLITDCYNGMFYNCANLTSISCLATDHMATNCTQGWTTGVASEGTFVKDSNTTWSSGVNGIPSSWTIIDA